VACCLPLVTWGQHPSLYEHLAHFGHRSLYAPSIRFREQLAATHVPVSWRLSLSEAFHVCAAGQVIQHRLAVYDASTAPLLGHYRGLGLLRDFHVRKGIKDSPALLEAMVAVS
jgi:hypothetical protein